MVLLLTLGGKILARYDVPAHEFLYPEDESKGGELRKVPLEKSRQYIVSMGNH